MPSGVRPCICRWQGAKGVLCTRGSAEREQQPRNLSVGEEQQAVKENPLLGEQGLKECSNKFRRAQGYSKFNKTTMG